MCDPSRLCATGSACVRFIEIVWHRLCLCVIHSDYVAQAPPECEGLKTCGTGSACVRSVEMMWDSLRLCGTGSACV